MGRYTDKLRAQSQGLERNRVSITLGGEQVDIYSLPMTGLDFDWICRQHKDFVENPTVGGIVDLMIRKCTDEVGEPIFDKQDRPHLMRQDMVWLTMVQNALFPVDDTDLSDERIEDEVGNSDETEA